MLKKYSHCNLGFGCKQFTVAVYIGNRPNMLEYENCVGVHPLGCNEITEIGIVCGNGWRKVFNVYSKLLYALDRNIFSFFSRAFTWQLYRDNFLLQKGCATALLFSPPILDSNNNIIHIISGKTYANELINSGELMVSLVWLDEYFAIDVANRVIVCPYFDYRQLSNIKIEYLADLMKLLVTGKASSI